MLCGALRTKERWIIIALIALIVLVSGFFFINGLSVKKKYEEQAVMAEEYLGAGNYEQAVEAYLKAMSMKNSDKELLSIGLAEAYTGINNYDKALEVLRDCYQNTGGVAVKEKIEEVTLRKTDYDYLQIISHADTYFANSEYEKAITEYEKAKLIKSKEAASYKKIAEAYVAMGNYSLAREEVMRGLALTQSGELNNTLKYVDSFLLKSQYDGIVNVASEYIYQENYEDGIKKYEEAIALLPAEENAYNRLAEVYITLEDYEEAIRILEGAQNNINSATLEEILDRANFLKAERDERKRILEELYNAMKDLDTDKILEVMESSFFNEKVAVDNIIYYNTLGEGDSSQGYGMILFGGERIYYGDMKNGIKQGTGTLFIRTRFMRTVFTRTDSVDGRDWYYYKGEWNNDVPSGLGIITETVSKTDEDGNAFLSRIVTEGKFSDGRENGLMQKVVYKDGIEQGKISYEAVNGIPVQYLNESGKPVKSEEADSYVIGEWYLDGKATGEYYSVKNNTIWGVQSYR